jgi:hypothetical protein
MITISFDLEKKELCITHELDKYWYNLDSYTITQGILDFLNESGIEKSEHDRVCKINESNDILLEENKNLKKLIGECSELNIKVRKLQEVLMSELLYQWTKKI